MVELGLKLLAKIALGALQKWLERKDIRENEQLKLKHASIQCANIALNFQIENPIVIDHDHPLDDYERLRDDIKRRRIIKLKIISNKHNPAT